MWGCRVEQTHWVKKCLFHVRTFSIAHRNQGCLEREGTGYNPPQLILPRVHSPHNSPLRRALTLALRPCRGVRERQRPRDLGRDMFAFGQMEVFVTLKGSSLSWPSLYHKWLVRMPSSKASKRERCKRSLRIKFPCVSPVTADGLHTDKLHAFGDLQMGK